MISKLLAFRESPQEQIIRLEHLRQKNGMEFQRIHDLGKHLLHLTTTTGNLKDIHFVLQKCQPEEILYYYTIRMFETACLTGKYDLVHYMINHGYDVFQCSKKELLHQVVEKSTNSNHSMQTIISCLINNKVDVNYQRKLDLYSPLHIACQNNLYEIACLLIAYGADVNAVAKNDSMPLILAMESKCLDRTRTQQLISHLENCGARMSWRKEKKVEMEWNSPLNTGNQPLGNQMLDTGKMLDTGECVFHNQQTTRYVSFSGSCT